MKRKNRIVTWEEIAQAARDLGPERMKVAAIACKLGYSTASAFSHRLGSLGKSFSDVIREAHVAQQ